MPRTTALFVLLLLLSACATVPDALRGDFPSGLTPSLVQLQPQGHIGQVVRWGGVILGLQNHHDRSTLEILAYPLDDSSRPIPDQASLGRFLVEMKQFLDPASFETRREVSVVGTIQGLQTRKIGEYEYQYPVLEGRAVHLWAKRQALTPDYDDPWSPWYPYPWYAPYPYPYHR